MGKEGKSGLEFLISLKPKNNLLWRKNQPLPTLFSTVGTCFNSTLQTIHFQDCRLRYKITFFTTIFVFIFGCFDVEKIFLIFKSWICKFLFVLYWNSSDLYLSKFKKWINFKILANFLFVMIWKTLYKLHIYKFKINLSISIFIRLFSKGNCFIFNFSVN